MLQRQKSCREKLKNSQKGDVVLLRADFSQNHWTIARIVERFTNKYRIVQSFKLKLGDAIGVDGRELVRSKEKIFLFVESDSTTGKKKC